ncbi:TonB family protein [Ochrobactrum sp. 19YEA23]|uniref:energy transducer TonB family protein n=1 Tax=Ochrobactrum sp. 19YEA23 TaxID=3039854 RepID=UPI002479D17E|nr:TonB family protein [Ochrobactrum sp. 19YEA23]
MKMVLNGIALMATFGVGVSLANEPASREEAFRLANQVRKCFRMPLNQSGDAVIEFRLHKNGRVTEIETVKSGGFTNYVVGLAAEEAVKKCQPYQTSIVGKVRVPFIFKSAAPITEEPQSQ